jgi:predicted Fe-Mo cluster-binding NifX family protein
MKIAVVTNDQRTVCPHFGRATHYQVFTVEGNTIVDSESRPKVGHHSLSHDHSHDHGHHAGHHQGADQRHQQMVATIQDCQVVIVGGMGGGAQAAMQEAGISPCSTEVGDAEQAVYAYLAGTGFSEPDCPDKTTILR